MVLIINAPYGERLISRAREQWVGHKAYRNFDSWGAISFKIEDTWKYIPMLKYKKKRITFLFPNAICGRASSQVFDGGLASISKKEP